MGILSQIEVSRGYQYVMKMLASCYFVLKYSFSLKLVFVIFPCNTRFTFLPTYLVNHSSKHSHSYNIQAPNLGVISYLAFSSPQHRKIYPNLLLTFSHYPSITYRKDQALYNHGDLESSG